MNLFVEYYLKFLISFRLTFLKIEENVFFYLFFNMEDKNSP